MARRVCLKFAYPAALTRFGKTTRGHVSEDVHSMVEELDPALAPVVGRLFHPGRLAPAMEYRLHGDVLLRPVLDEDGGIAVVDGHGHLDHGRLGDDYPCPPSMVRIDSRGEVRPCEAVRVGATKDRSLYDRVSTEARHDALRAQSAFSSGLRLLDDRLWRAAPPPVWCLFDRHSGIEGHAEAGRYYLAAKAPDRAMPSVLARNPVPFPDAAMATFDPRLPARSMEEALRAFMGRALVDGVSGGIDWQGAPQRPLEAENAWLVGMAAFGTAENATSKWSGLGHEERADMAEAVARAVRMADGRDDVDATVAFMLGFVERRRDSTRPPAWANAHLVADALNREVAPSNDEATFLGP